MEINTKPLNFNYTCFAPFPYRDRKARFTIDYSQIPIPLVFSEDLKLFNNYIHNTAKKRISFLLPDDGTTKRCQFSTRLISEHPNCRRFLDTFKRDNPSVIDAMINFYVMDDEGTDIPLIPNTSDMPSMRHFDNIITFGLIGGVIYAVYSMSKKKKRR